MPRPQAIERRGRGRKTSRESSAPPRSSSTGCDCGSSTGEPRRSTHCGHHTGRWTPAIGVRRPRSARPRSRTACGRRPPGRGKTSWIERRLDRHQHPRGRRQGVDLVRIARARDVQFPGATVRRHAGRMRDCHVAHARAAGSHAQRHHQVLVSRLTNNVTPSRASSAHQPRDGRVSSKRASTAAASRHWLAICAAAAPLDRVGAPSARDRPTRNPRAHPAAPIPAFRSRFIRHAPAYSRTAALSPVVLGLELWRSLTIGTSTTQ